jgi:hypothetical protein
MKLWSHLSIILLLSPSFLVVVSGTAEEVDRTRRLNGTETDSEVDDAQQGGVGPDSTQGTTSRETVPDEAPGEAPESQGEDTKIVDRPIEAQQPNTEVYPDSLSTAGGSAKRAEEENAARQEDNSVAHHEESNHHAENSEGVQSSKDGSGARLSESEQERLDEPSLVAASPETLSVDRTEPADERITDEKRMGQRSTSESVGPKTFTDESVAKSTAEGPESVASETQQSDRDSLESMESDARKVDSGLDSVHDTPETGSAKPPVNPQTTNILHDEAETATVASLEANATGVDETPSQEMQETMNVTSIVSDADDGGSPDAANELPTANLSETGLSDETHGHPLCGVWGTVRDRRRADLKVLYSLFENIELGEPQRKEIPNPEDWASQITEDGLKESRRGGRRNASDSSSTTSKTRLEQDEQSLNETKAAKSANSEFVDGLDDIGKFFEDVEPPDELDVGAVGSSLQEVLMGQGTQIILKRLRMGLHFVRTTFLTAKDMFAQRFIDEDGNLTIVDQERLEAVAAGVWKFSKRLYHEAQTFVDRLVERGIAGGLSREYEEEDDASSVTPPTNNDDVRELLRQYSRVGGGATPKKYA